MQYVYLGLAAIVAFLFVYRKMTHSKKTDEYFSDDKKNQTEQKK